MADVTANGQQCNSGRSQSENYPTRREYEGIIGLVNIGNSCYMNASLQALSNCPPFCQYFIECFHASQTGTVSHALNQIFKKMWMSERNPGSLNPRIVSSNMRQQIFRGSAQQDAQEFIRCLLSQVHDELSVPVYQNVTVMDEMDEMESEVLDHQQEQPLEASTLSMQSHSSTSSTGSLAKLMDASECHSASSSPATDSRDNNSSRVRNIEKTNSLPNSPLANSRVTEKAVNFYNHIKSEGLQRKKQSHQLLNTSPCEEMVDVVGDQGPSQPTVKEEDSPLWQIRDTIVVDLLTGKAFKHRHKEDDASEDSNRVSLGSSNDKAKRSIITEVFEGEVESSVECLNCRNVSTTKEPFHDLSLPIPSRKDMSIEIDRPDDNETDFNPTSPTLSTKMCRLWKVVIGWAQDVVMDPPTSLRDCLNAFFDSSELTGENRYFCEHCNSLQNSRKKTVISKLPEILCVHLKRFRYDAFFASKISRYIEFPLTDLDLSRYVRQSDRSDHSRFTYKLVSMVTHYGGAAGGHYVAFAMNHKTEQWHEFNDSHVSRVSGDRVADNEAYLLFYRKVPVTPIPTLDIADIIPPPEIMIPSKDTAYISRHWLLLRNLCLDPGPLLQYDYACDHGGVLPGREKYVERLILPIQKIVWLDLVKKYGGSTPLESKATCTKCQSYLDELLTRREKEKNEANEIQVEDKSSPSSYVLSMLWLKQWQKFINCKSLEVDPPGPINNSNLLQSSKDGTIKFRTKSQYRTISYRIWRYLFDIYGGGPHITTSSPDTLEL